MRLSKTLLRYLLAFRLQAEAFGDLSPATRKLLAGIAREPDDGTPGSAVPLSGQGQLMPGTVLVREHGGEAHHVMVVEDGFAWKGKTYRSLSKVAHAITGTKWNGRTFFGVSDRRTSS